MSSSSSDYPPFNPKGSRYDQSEFIGRFKHFMDITDMSTIFVSQERLEECKRMMKQYEEGTLSPLPSNKDLWDAKKIVDATIHPDTGEKIPIPVRLSAFLPVNVIICAGMLMPNPTVGATILWQWINQTYNIALNHANRNASNVMPTSQIVQSYVTAVSISCGVALGLRSLVDKALSSASAVLRSNIKMFIPFTAVSIAGIANVCIMRRNEMKEGIQVKDKEGNVVGTSQTVGKRAIAQVCVSRVCTALPALVLPPILMSSIERTSFVRNNPRLSMPINLALLAGIFYTSLPAATAIFPQQAEVSVDKLEPRFHHLSDRSGAPIRFVYYNKGL